MFSDSLAHYCVVYEYEANGFKVHTRVPVVISNGLRAAPARRYAKSNPPPQPPSAGGRSVKTIHAKNTEKKSPIHENGDAHITCDFGDGDISRFRSRLPHTCSLARL